MFSSTRITFNIVSTMHPSKKRKLVTPADSMRQETTDDLSATVVEGHFSRDRNKAEKDVAASLSTTLNQLAAMEQLRSELTASRHQQGVDRIQFKAQLAELQDKHEIEIAQLRAELSVLHRRRDTERTQFQEELAESRREREIGRAELQTELAELRSQQTVDRARLAELYRQQDFNAAKISELRRQQDEAIDRAQFQRALATLNQAAAEFEESANTRGRARSMDSATTINRSDQLQTPKFGAEGEDEDDSGLYEA